MAKTYTNRQLVGGNQIKNDYQKINLNADELNADLTDLYAQDAALQSNIDTEEQNRINADGVLDTRIDNIIAQSGTSDTEVVDARQSTTLGVTYTLLKDRLEFIEQSKADKVQEEQFKLTLINSWVDSSASAGIKVFKDDFGVVRIEAEFKDGTATSGIQIAVLPVGYRPSGNVRFNSVRTNDGTSISTLISTSGSINLFGTFATGTFGFTTSFKAV